MTTQAPPAPAALRRPLSRRAAAWSVVAVLAVAAPVPAARALGAAAPAAPSVAAAEVAAPVAVDGDGDGWAGFAVVPERPAPEFSLTDQSGAPWALSSTRGRVTALFFGYTRCPDVCPQTMQRLQQAVATLGPAGDDVAVVLVTTDPAHDTPDLLARYVGGFDPRFVGLSGSTDDIRAVADLYGALPAVAPGDAGDAAADADAAGGHGAPIAPTLHASRLWLIDAAGQLRVYLTGPYTPADVAHDLQLLLAERR